MEKKAIRVVGILFILWGLAYIVDFLWAGNQPRTLVYVKVFGYNIVGLVFIIILLNIGLNILRLRNSGRIWGLIILWLYFVPNFVVLIFLIVYAINPNIIDSSTDIPLVNFNPSISFNGTDYGLSQDYTSTNLWLLLAFSALITTLIGLQILILSSKRNRTYFTVE